MAMRGVLFAWAVLLAGHASAQDVVAWGNSGSIHGARTITVTPDDRVVIHARRGADVPDDVVLILESGSFEELQERVRVAIVFLNGKIKAPEHVCMDAGTDFIERRMDDDVDQFEDFGCPDPAVQDTITTLNDFVRQATVE
ncbi:MAG: hypothetical protein ACSHWY_11040 [Octadecabacter sp.]